VRKLYTLFFHRLPLRKVNTDEELFLLNDTEIAAIRKNERFAIWCAAFFGAMGVILLYVPQYALPGLFPVSKISLGSYQFDIPIVMLVYTVLLVIVEIILLTFLNIYCTHQVAVATGFLHYNNKSNPDKQKLLIDLGLEKKNKDILRYGIDPMQGLNKKALMAWNFLFIMKATLSNMLFKVFIQRVLGRYAVKAVQDFAGIPIFAFWNAWGTKVILQEVRVVIMGQNTVAYLCSRIRKDQEPAEDFKMLLYDTLQYIAVSKRDFHQNHYILTKNLFDIYQINPKKAHWLEEGYYEKLRHASEEQREVCQLLIVTGFLLDGKLSHREKKQVEELHAAGLLDLPYDTIKQYQQDFLNGKGIEALISRYIEPI
jgi:hypothetical protein